MKKNNKPRKIYFGLFALSGVFFVLSALLSVNGISSYALPFSPLFVVVACVVLLVEVVLVWRVSIRRGRKAYVYVDKK